MSDKTGENYYDRTVEAYVAYLIARASGVTSQTTRDYKWSLGERYAAALGVHHFHRGTKPLSQRRLLEEAEAACQRDDLLPTPPDPGATGDRQLIGRLAHHISGTFPEVEAKGFGCSAAVVDAAIALLAELREARDRAEERQRQAPTPWMSAGPWVRCPGERGVAFLEAVQAGLVVADPPVVPAEESDVELGPVGASTLRIRGLTAAGRAYVAARQSPPPPTVASPADEAVLSERAACVAWLRKWPNAIAEVLADQIEVGAHTAPADPLGPTPPDPG